MTNLAHLLQQQLVETCIKFIEDYHAHEINAVRFTIDCLDGPKWTPEMDSTCEILTIGKDGYESIGFSG